MYEINTGAWVPDHIVEAIEERESRGFRHPDHKHWCAIEMQRKEKESRDNAKEGDEILNYEEDYECECWRYNNFGGPTYWKSPRGPRAPYFLHNPADVYYSMIKMYKSMEELKPYETTFIGRYEHEKEEAYKEMIEAQNEEGMKMIEEFALTNMKVAQKVAK